MSAARPLQIEKATPIPTSPTVFIIDDDEAVLDALGELFAAVGIAAKTYASAVAFLEAAPALDNACVLTDVEMPGVTGLELIRRLAAEGVTAPVIVMSARVSPSLEADCRRLGAVTVLRKPLDEALLLATIEAA